jgi:hypothetical protein
MQGSNPGSHKAALLWRGRPPFGKNQSTSRRLGVSAAWLNKAAAAPHLPPARNERLSSHIPLTTPSLDCLRPAEGGTALPWLGCVPEARGRGVSEAMWKSAFIPLSTQTHNTHTPPLSLERARKPTPYILITPHLVGSPYTGQAGHWPLHSLAQRIIEPSSVRWKFLPVQRFLTTPFRIRLTTPSLEGGRGVRGRCVHEKIHHSTQVSKSHLWWDCSTPQRSCRVRPAIRRECYPQQGRCIEENAQNCQPYQYLSCTARRSLPVSTINFNKSIGGSK